jgi:hypothetical protein
MNSMEYYELFSTPKMEVVHSSETSVNFTGLQGGSFQKVVSIINVVCFVSDHWTIEQKLKSDHLSKQAIERARASEVELGSTPLHGDLQITNCAPRRTAETF